MNFSLHGNLIFLCSLIAEIEDKFFDINTSYGNNAALIDKVNDLSSDIDMLTTKNELIIPDKLYSKINDCATYYHKISSLSYKTPDKINQELKEEFLSKGTSLIMDIGDYIGLEHMSEENRKLVKGKLYRD